MAKTNLRFATVADAPLLAIIEAATFEFTWDEVEFRRLLSKPETRCLLAFRDHLAVGFSLWEEQTNGYDLHLVSLAVPHREAGAGIGSQFIEYLIRQLSPDRPAIRLKVRVTNIRAQNFYRCWGFRRVGRIRGYFEPNGEDAFVMVLDARLAPTRYGKRLARELLQLIQTKWAICVNK